MSSCLKLVCFGNSDSDALSHVVERTHGTRATSYLLQLELYFILNFGRNKQETGGGEGSAGRGRMMLMTPSHIQVSPSLLSVRMCQGGSASVC